MEVFEDVQGVSGRRSNHVHIIGHIIKVETDGGECERRTCALSWRNGARHNGTGSGARSQPSMAAESQRPEPPKPGQELESPAQRPGIQSGAEQRLLTPTAKRTLARRELARAAGPTLA